MKINYKAMSLKQRNQTNKQKCVLLVLVFSSSLKNKRGNNDPLSKKSLLSPNVKHFPMNEPYGWTDKQARSSASPADHCSE